ncbi:MAG: hypothetical protein VXZ15_15720, partial [Planctomycetota bacterium]|nr:hypothetical protein [Planctomycetota bacterium]
ESFIFAEYFPGSFKIAGRTPTSHVRSKMIDFNSHAHRTSSQTLPLNDRDKSHKRLWGLE